MLTSRRQIVGGCLLHMIFRVDSFCYILIHIPIVEDVEEMQHYMPEICWHDRAGLLSVDIHPLSRENNYKIVTSSVQVTESFSRLDFVYRLVRCITMYISYQYSFRGGLWLYESVWG